MRFWEIDSARGLAVVLMVIFNYAFALQYLRVASLDLGWLFWWLFPRIIASIFIIIAGISFTISYSRMAKKKTKLAMHKKYLLRGGKIFTLGLFATAATWAFFHEGTIFFGILHFLGLAIMLSPLLIKAGRWIPALAAAFIAAGIFLQALGPASPWLLWLGLPPGIYMFDYFPLLPWLGIFLAGIFIGNALYRNGKRSFRIFDEKTLSKPLSFLGRRSLLLYVLHQPALLIFLYAVGYSLF